MNDQYANRWQLPDGVNELLPYDAWRVESLRRKIMDNAYRWGYELVMPPMIEFLDGLLTGTGETLDLQTFKIIDQQNGRSLGIRADMTPQVARMDAHALRRDTPNRFFYTGSVLRARTDGAGSSRTPVQFGAELFGHSGPESDAEVLQLMLESVKLADINLGDVLLDIGHVGVYRALAEQFSIPEALEIRLFDALLRGSRPEAMQLLRAQSDAPQMARLAGYLDTLLALSGECHSVLQSAREQFRDAGLQVSQALDNLQGVIEGARRLYPDVRFHLDLSELRGFSYHTGILFKLYDFAGAELARGGRYDAIGEAFGRARPATGFSGDLVRLALTEPPVDDALPASSGGVWVGDTNEPGALQAAHQLRCEGERVVTALSGAAMQASDYSCDRQLVMHNGQWIIQSL